MSPPTTVELLGQTFIVSFVGGDDPRLQSSKDLIGVGRMRLSKQELVIANDQGFDQERDTVVHEVLHGLLTMVGHFDDDADDREEHLVAVLAPLLLQALRHNPALVAYLTELGNA